MSVLMFDNILLYCLLQNGIFWWQLPWKWTHKPVKNCLFSVEIDWLIIYRFTSRSRIFHLYGDITIAGEGLQKFRPMLGAQGLWAGRDLYRATPAVTPAVTRDLGFSGFIRRTAPISRLLRHTWGCGGSILTRIFTGPLSVAFHDTQRDVEDLF